MRLQYDDEFDLDVRFTFSGVSSMAAGGEPGRALPATAQGQTCGHRQTCHTCETECQEASCEPNTCRTCDTQCDQDKPTCPDTCAGATCQATQCGTCQATQCGTCATQCDTCVTCGETCGRTRCCETDTCAQNSICPSCDINCHDA